MSGLNTQFGTKTETTFGTLVAVDRWWEIMLPEGLQADVEHHRVTATRPGNKHGRADEWYKIVKGAGGPIKLPVRAKKFGWWLPHLVGGSVTTTGPASSAYTHAAASGLLSGLSFSAQKGVPSLADVSGVPTEVVNPFSYPGNKVASWGFECALDDVLYLDLVLAGNTELPSGGGAQALQSATFPSTTPEALCFVGATVSVGGTVFDAGRSIKFNQDNGLKVDRRFARINPLSKEPVEATRRVATFEIDGEFDGLTTAYNRFMAASPSVSGAVAQIVLFFQAPTAISGSVYPSLTVTLPFCDFDNPGIVAASEDILDQSIKGMVWDDPAGSSAAVQLSYVTADSTP